MNSLSRRSFLRSAAIGVGALSGCAGFSGQTEVEPPRLIDLIATNFTPDPHTFHVRMDLQDETVYRESKHMEAASPDDPRAAVFTDYPAQPNPYVFYTWVDEQPETEAQSLDFTEKNAECVGINVQFGRYKSGVQDPSVSIFSTTNCNID